MFCKRCGKKLAVDAIFCQYCGDKISIEPAADDKDPSIAIGGSKTETVNNTRICDYCKRKNPAIAVRCTYCGRDIRSKEEKRPKTDLWGPLFTLLIIGAFFLPWFSYRRWSGTGSDVFSEAHHPEFFLIIFIFFAFITIMLFLANLSGNTGGYKARGITAMLSGFISTIYFILFAAAFASVYDWKPDIGFNLSLVFSILLIISGISTTFFLSKKKRTAGIDQKSKRKALKKRKADEIKQISAAAEKMKKAIAAEVRFKFDDAIRLYKEILKEYPESEEAKDAQISIENLKSKGK